uniref:Kinesin motor domain-containing protein n=1 Tax=Schistocephalus solidus TaxID=70667 RepID=A0A183SBS6_SCHSO
LDHTRKMDNCNNSRANTCAEALIHEEINALIRSEANQVVFFCLRVGAQLHVVLLVTLDNCYRSQSALRRRVLQMSALSTFDGRLPAYHGDNE